MEEAKAIWQSFGVRCTPCREAVVECLVRNSTALSERELRDELEARFDRTTFYRTVKTLEDKGVIHRIVADMGVVKYAMNDTGRDTPTHGHFLCKRCGQVWCLHGVGKAKYILPVGCVAEEEEFVVRGFCGACAMPRS